jgi:hypothetical protein
LAPLSFASRTLVAVLPGISDRFVETLAASAIATSVSVADQIVVWFDAGVVGVGTLTRISGPSCHTLADAAAVASAPLRAQLSVDALARVVVAVAKLAEDFFFGVGPLVTFALTAPADSQP